MNKRGPKPFDMKARSWGRLVALEYVSKGNWRFSCECGAEKTLWATDVRRGKIKSCGCLAREVKATGDLRRVHGACGPTGNTPEYTSWNAMMTRCFNENAFGYHRYGGRGITVCDRWKNFASFLEDMGMRPEGTSLDRIDPNGNYTPDNCRWATRDVQNVNKVNSVYLTVGDDTRPLTHWASDLGCAPGVITSRVKRGWPIEKAVLTPVRAVRRW